jgi:PAS domain S-box-containing protein
MTPPLSRPSRKDVKEEHGGAVERLMLGLSLCIVAATFVIDITTPRGVAAGVFPHYLAIFFAALTRRPGYPVVLATVAGGLTIAGYLMTSGGAPMVVLVNRIIIVVSFFLFAALGEALIRARQREARRLKQVEDDAAERTRDLMIAERRLREFTNATPSGICCFGPDGRIIFVNSRFRSWFGVSDGDVVGRTVGELILNEGKGCFASFLRTVMTMTADTADSPDDLTVFDGTPVAFHVLRFPIIGEGGEDQGFGVIFRDMTPLRRAEAQLRQAQKMEAVGQLTGGLAHDFNNFLTVISGNIQLLLQGHDAMPTEQALRAALRATNRRSELTHRLLSFSRSSPISVEDTNINEAISGLEGLLHTTLGHNNVLELRLAENLWAARIDPAQLDNALLNIANNARDAMPDGGRLVIETANRTLESPMHFESGSVIGAGRYVQIRLTDNGIGMSRQVQARIFEPFFTTKGKDAGSGLGLAMVYDFINQTGAGIHVESAPGKGTTFEILLPAHDSQGVAAPEDIRGEPLPEAPAPMTPAGRILVVDDDDVRAFIVTVVEALGYDTVDFADAASALDLIDGGDMPDLLITDVIMPGMDGYALAREAVACLPDLPVIYVSGYLGASTRLNREKFVDGSRVLAKPFTQPQLAEALSAMLRQPAPSPLTTG